MIEFVTIEPGVNSNLILFELMKAKQYLCTCCSTTNEPVYTRGRTHKDGQITCGKCGSNELEEVKK